MTLGNQLLKCDDRFTPSDEPWCEDFFHLIRFIPIQDFEQFSTSKATKKFGKQLQKPITARPFSIEATEEHLAHVLRCALLGANRQTGGIQKVELPRPHAKIIATEAEEYSRLLWQDYGNKFLRRCSATRIPLVCRDIEIALIVQYRQCWKPQGYWRGELLNSLSLAPGEELTLEMFTWDRHKIERERSTEASSESSESGTLTSRSSSEVVTSAEFRMKAGAEGKIGGSLALKEMDIPADVDGSIGGNFETEFKGAITVTQNRLNEATRSVSNTLRTARKTRVVETAEFGSETRSTRRIKNENRCHTVNYDYFEILEQYEVTVAAENTQFVALVPLPETGEIDAAWVLCHEHPIRANLLHRTYEKGFEAARMLRSAAILRKQLTAATPPPVPATPPTDGDSTPPPKDTLGDHLRVFVRAIIDAKNRLEQANASPADYANLFHWDETTRTNAFRRVSKVTTRNFILAVYPGLFNRIEELAAHQNDSGTILASRLQVLKTQVVETGLMNAISQPLKLEAFPLLIFDFDDEGLIGALDAVFIQLDNLGPGINVQAAADAVLPAGPSSDGNTNDSVAQQTLVLSPIEQILDERYGLETLAEAQVELDRLLCHLHENMNYYQTILFTQRGSQAMDDLLVACPQIALMVERRVIGVQSGYVIFPLRSFLQRDRQAIIKEMLDKISEQNQANNQYTVMLPTNGTVLEARLGQCNACEPFVQEHRIQDIKLRKAEVAQAEAAAAQAAETARRYRLRLDTDPPLLDDPEVENVPMIQLHLDQHTHAEGETDG